MLEATYDGQVL